MKFARCLVATMLAALLLCSLCVPALAYTDVAISDESTPKIEFVDRLGVLPSAWNGDFNPEQYLSRAEAIVAVYRMLYGADIDPTPYEDVELDFDANDYGASTMLKAYLCWAVDNYLITTNVDDGIFQSAQAITANEFMTLLAKVLRLVDDAEASYPDDYTSAVADIVGSIQAGDKPVTRKQAAVAFANAIVSADGQEGEIGVYVDFDGNPTDSLATNVYHMATVELIIRATVDKKLGYNVQNGVLLSNGADLKLSEDLTDYIGYGINLTYRDADNSGTFTEDEEVLTYSISSTVCVTVPLEEVTISSGNAITVSVAGTLIRINTETYMYLNDAPWPINDDKYNLVKLVSAIGVVTNIQNRSNMKLKCLAANSEAPGFATVFATEAKPGKIVGINKGYYSVYDYYCAGTAEEIKVYHINDCVFTTPVKVGDYVNFYEADGKCYAGPGTTLLTSVKSEIAGGYTLADDTVLKKHMFFRAGDERLDVGNADKKYQFIVDDAGANLLFTWEKVKTNYSQLMIDSITPGDGFHTIIATNLQTAASVTFDVLFDNVDSSTPLAVGDFINYSDSGEETPVVYVQKTAPKTLTVVDMGEYFLDGNSGAKYYKNTYYQGNLGTGGDFVSGTATLNLDMANCVVSIIY